MKKRLLAALLTSALALSLTACGGGTDSSATDGGDTASTHDGPYKISMVLKTNAAESLHEGRPVKISEIEA